MFIKISKTLTTLKQKVRNKKENKKEAICLNAVHGYPYANSSYLFKKNKKQMQTESIQNITNQTLDGLHLQLFIITFCYI